MLIIEPLLTRHIPAWHTVCPSASAHALSRVFRDGPCPKPQKSSSESSRRPRRRAAAAPTTAWSDFKTFKASSLTKKQRRTGLKGLWVEGSGQLTLAAFLHVLQFVRTGLGVRARSGPVRVMRPEAALLQLILLQDIRCKLLAQNAHCTSTNRGTF